MKLLLFLSALFSFIYTPMHEEDDYDIILEEKEVMENDIVKIYGNKTSFYFHQNYLFTIEDSYCDYLVIDKNLYIAYIENDYLMIKTYDDSGKLLKTKKIDNKSFQNSNIKILKSEDKIIIFSSITENEDIYILELDLKLNYLKDKSLGGQLQEQFLDIIFIEQSLFIIFKHDPMSKGDFEYGGNYIISKLDMNYEVLETKCLNEDKYLYMDYDSNHIQLHFLSSLIEFDLSLNHCFSYCFNKSIIYATSCRSKNCHLSFYPDRLEFYHFEYDEINDKNNIKVFKTYSFDIGNKYLKDVMILDDTFFLTFTDDYLDYIYSLEIYNVKDFVKEITYLDGISGYNKQINNWFNDVDLEIIESNLNPEVNGTYEIIYGYKDYRKTMIVHVLEEENVKEGMIYPLSYKLYFTGVAFLNNKMIHNNYSISEEGNYVLELYSNKKEKRTINFTVSKSQIDFQNYVIPKADFEARVDKNITIIYKMPVINDDFDVIVDEMDYQKYDYKDGIIKVDFSFDKPGFYKKVINSINGNIINDIITFNIIEDDPVINFTLLENRKNIELIYENEYDNIRMFNVYLDNNFYKSYPIGDNNIILPYEKNYNQIKVMLAYEQSCNKLYEKELFTSLVDEDCNSDFIKIEIVKKEENVDRYKLSLSNKDKVEMIKNEEKVIFEHVEDDDYIINIVIISLIAANISLLIT